MKESRIKEMADYIGIHQNVALEHLSEKFGISIYTVRRDVDELVDRGIVIKRYGGVSINKSKNYFLGFEERNTLYKNEKQRICQRAASLVKQGDIVYIDGGTTTQYIPDYLENIEITVVTNNIFVIPRVISKSNMKLVILGGEVNRKTGAITDLDTIEFLKKINITKSFLACTGVSNEFNLTNFTVVEAELKRLCINRSVDSYLLADNSKFGLSSLVTYGTMDQLSAIITDRPLEGIFKKYCALHGVNCIHE